jgi:hypothetical protein
LEVHYSYTMYFLIWCRLYLTKSYNTTYE